MADSDCEEVGPQWKGEWERAPGGREAADLKGTDAFALPKPNLFWKKRGGGSDRRGRVPLEVDGREESSGVVQLVADTVLRITITALIEMTVTCRTDNPVHHAS